MKQRWLAHVARREDWRYGVEIGVLEGRHMEWMLLNNPQLHMIGVDPWQSFPDRGMDPSGESWSDRDMQAMYERTRKRLQDYRAELWRMTSKEAVTSVPDCTLDFVMIDGDHRYDAVCEDIVLWQPKVRPGGLLCGDDAYWGTVIQAVCDELGSFCVADKAWYQWQ